ncbi:MAG: PKD domain-containing protein [Crocinitomicaceae bacterium]|nr:PD40 domain-containing protein [Crocinitomicaceae bacterium]
MVRLILTYLFFICAIGYSQEAKVQRVENDLRGDVFSPAFFRDKLVVCSNQKDRYIKTVIDNNNAEPADLYVLSEDGTYERFDELFRTNYNDGPVSFSSDGNSLVISRNIKVDQKVGLFQTTENRLALYESHTDYYGWNRPKLLSFIDTAYQYSHPSLNETGDRLVFVSNMPGGEGGFDIWISHKKKKGWSTPVNAGPEINTANNELFPSQDKGFIYFSSDRKGFGKLDIYAFNEKTSELEHLPEPINSSADDFGLISNSKLKNGYLSSNRNGKDELFSFEYERPTFEACDSIVSNNMCYTLYEENAHDYGNEDALIYEWHINVDTLRGVSIDYCFPGPGEYEITLDIIDTIIKKTYYKESYFLLTLDLEEQPYITCPDTVYLGQEFSLSSEETNLPGAQLNEYIWKFNDQDQVKGPKTKYSYSETGTFEIKLAVRGTKNGEPFEDCVFKSVVCTDPKTISNN